MKKVISSNGKFNITESLYNCIKKNNPELIEDYDPSFNVFAEYQGLIKDIIQKYRLNSNEVDDLEKKIKGFENGARESFDDSEKAYKYCKLYLDDLYKSSDKKDDFLSNLSSKYDPQLITNIIVKNKNKNNNNNVSYNNDNNISYNNDYSDSNINDDNDDIVNKKDKLNKDYSDYNIHYQSKESENMKTIPNNELKDAIDVFQNNYISQNTINFINNLSKKYHSKDIEDIDIIYDNDDFMTKKIKCIYRLRNYINSFINESYLNNKNILLEDDVEWTDKEKHIVQHEIDDNTYMKRIRKAILGLYNDSADVYNKLKIAYSNDSREKINSEIGDYKKILNLRSELFNYLLNNDYNLINYLDQNELEEFEDTLTTPAQGDTPDEKLNNAFERTKEIIDLIDICTFDTKIPGNINNFYQTILKQVKRRTLVGVTCAFNYFGKVSPKGFIISRPKEQYVDIVKNDGVIYKGIPAFEAYKAIPQKEFWKNVAYIDCRTKDSLGIVSAALGDLSIRQEVNIQQKIISTGLNTTTILYTLSSNSDNIWEDGKVLIDRNDKEIEDIDYDSLSPDEKRIVQKIKRRYFIIVSEGLFRKGEMISTIANKAKNYFGRDKTPRFDTKDIIRV